jgi:RimJ/RimL family protein N-acetyltransferase
MTIRIAAHLRGRGVGREVLRQLADHHFAASPHLNRLAGRAHERNVPMQRAFNAAGFRMEARYRESYRGGDGPPASEWGYALTRSDWDAGRHRADAHGYDLHGITLEIEESIQGKPPPRDWW